MAFNSTAATQLTMGRNLAQKKHMDSLNFRKQGPPLNTAELADAVWKYNGCASFSAGCSFVCCPINAACIAADDICALFCQVLSNGTGECQALFTGVARTNNSKRFRFYDTQVSGVEKNRGCLLALKRGLEQPGIVIVKSC